jgi:hypothetical protein
VGGRGGCQYLTIFGHWLCVDEGPLGVGVASGGRLRGTEDHGLGVHGELLEAFGVDVMMEPGRSPHTSVRFSARLGWWW